MFKYVWTKGYLVWMSELLIKPCVCVCVRVSITHIANVLLLELVAMCSFIYHVLVIEADVSTTKFGQVL